MDEEARKRVLGEVLAGELRAIREYVKDIPSIRDDLETLKTDVSELKSDIKAIKAVVREHDEEIRILKQEVA